MGDNMDGQGHISHNASAKEFKRKISEARFSACPQLVKLLSRLNPSVASSLITSAGNVHFEMSKSHLECSI